MSGGHFGSAAFNIQDSLDHVSKDEYILKDYLKLSKLFDVLGDVLYGIIHDLDYSISGDSLIKDRKEFQEIAIKKIKEIVNENF